MATATSRTPRMAANPDHARIKKLYAALAKKALTAITKDSGGNWGASNVLSGYAQLHGAWLMAVADAHQRQTAVAIRKAEARYAKLVTLHNDLAGYNSDVEALDAKYTKALGSTKTSEKTIAKLRTELDAAREKALKANGIGDRKAKR